MSNVYSVFYIYSLESTAVIYISFYLHYSFSDFFLSLCSSEFLTYIYIIFLNSEKLSTFLARQVFWQQIPSDLIFPSLLKDNFAGYGMLGL